MKKRKWLTEVIYVEQETGQILTKEEVKQHYVIIKTKKHVRKERLTDYKHGFDYTGGTIEITKQCTRTGKQGRLF